MAERLFQLGLKNLADNYFDAPIARCFGMCRASLVVSEIRANHLNWSACPQSSRRSELPGPDVAIGGTQIKTDDVVILDLDAAGLEFGAGQHHCPGRALAESICRGIADAVVLSGYEWTLRMPYSMMVDFQAVSS
jgi:hypothetical protein